MKKWICENRLTNFETNELLKLLLKNRGIQTEKEIEEFLFPKLENVTVKSVGIDKKELERTVARIRIAIEKKEQIVVFGDYDVDGICGTAILWETLYGANANVMPYIPHRVDEGYGLSIRGIENLKSQISNPKLIITVDNGIVACDAVDYANSLGINVIITDHHVLGEKKPDAYSTVHTTNLCGTGVAWMLAQELKIKNSKLQITNNSKIQNIKYPTTSDHLALVALATVADLVPLKKENRTLLKYGLETLKKTSRIGLLALYRESGIDSNEIDTYSIGHVISPRLNAMGRLEYAMDSLRLLCTKDAGKARLLAEKLGSTNKERQKMTIDSVLHAKNLIKNLASVGSGLELQNLLFLSHESYSPGVIGLIAGKLVEEYYRPVIVLSIGEKYSKASARSISGFNIIEFIRSASELLVDAGGHPMAAGFTVTTQNLPLLKEVLEKRANEIITAEMLTRTLRIDCEIDFFCINEKLYDAIQTMAPFGMKNPEPVFMSQQVKVEDIRFIGKEKNHVKFRISQKQNEKNFSFDAIAFDMRAQAKDIKASDQIDVVYSIDLNEWQGRKSIQLKVKDIKTIILPS